MNGVLDGCICKRVSCKCTKDNDICSLAYVDVIYETVTIRSVGLKEVYLDGRIQM